MFTLEELASNDQIKNEYKKSFLLNIFKKLVVMMKKDVALKSKIRKLFLESTDPTLTTEIIIRRYFNYELTAQDSQLMLQWIKAHFNKQDKRKAISAETKQRLCALQKGKCAVCGEDLEDDLSKIHVDHIVPWTLVGDELDNNYQCLCSTCNESKSAHTDYICKKLIKLD